MPKAFSSPVDCKQLSGLRPTVKLIGVGLSGDMQRIPANVVLSELRQQVAHRLTLWTTLLCSNCSSPSDVRWWRGGARCSAAQDRQ